MDDMFQDLPCTSYDVELTDEVYTYTIFCLPSQRIMN